MSLLRQMPFNETSPGLKVIDPSSLSLSLSLSHLKSIAPSVYSASKTGGDWLNVKVSLGNSVT